MKKPSEIIAGLYKKHTGTVIRDTDKEDVSTLACDLDYVIRMIDAILLYLDKTKQ